MIKKLTVNPSTGKLDVIGHIPQLDADPTSPAPEDAWVLATISGGSGGGSPYGLLLTITKPNTGGTSSYQFSFRTKEGTTKRVTLT